MHKVLIEKLKNILDDKSYSKVPINADKFKEISEINDNYKAAFVDGGNAEIFGNAGFSFSIVKTSLVVFA